MTTHQKFGRTDIFMLTAVVLWSINFPLIKIALQEFAPLAFNGIRLTFASLVLLFFLHLRGEKLAVSKSMFWKLTGLGLCGNTAYQMVFIHGIHHTTASNTAIIIALAPVIIALISAALRQESIHPAAWGGILISFIGFYLVISGQGGHFRLTWSHLRGDLLIFSGNLFWAVFTVLSKPLLKETSPLKLTTWTMMLGTVFYLPFCVRDILRLPSAPISTGAWAVLIYSGFFALAVCYVIWYTSVRRVGNSKTAIYDNLVPVFTVICAALFLGEKITVVQGLGAVVIFFGVYLARSGYRWFDRRPGKLKTTFREEIK